MSLLDYLPAREPPYPREQCGRHCALTDAPERADIDVETDLRRPEFRRATFLRFYEFHLRYRAHPGCVYALLPALAEHLGLDADGRMFLAFVNGNTQNPVTSWLLLKHFPEPRALRRGAPWFDAHWQALEWDMDRRYQKKDFLANVRWYEREAGATPWKHFTALARQGWADVWKQVRARFPTFGRLSAFSYLEYLRVLGIDLDCNDLLLTDIVGSMSHRNGLAKVLGRDDLDFIHRDPSYAAGQLEWLAAEAAALLGEAQARALGQSFAEDVSYFSLESALCTFKSWFRPNRRYANVYVDMLYERIRRAEQRWPTEDFSWWWEFRRRAWPPPLRVEDNPRDVGLAPSKQNHFRLTGRPPMLGYCWPEFWSDYDTMVQGVNGAAWHAAHGGEHGV